MHNQTSLSQVSLLSVFTQSEDLNTYQYEFMTLSSVPSPSSLQNEQAQFHTGPFRTQRNLGFAGKAKTESQNDRQEYKVIIKSVAIIEV